MAGGLGLVVDIALLWILAVHLGVPEGPAAATAFLAAGVTNFVLNRWVFAATSGSLGTQGVRYLILFGLNLAITTTVMAVAVPPLAHHLPHAAAVLVVKGVVVAALLCVNTIAYDRWVFAQAASRGELQESP